MQDKPDEYLPYTAVRGTIYTLAKTLVTGLSISILFMLAARFLPNVSDFGLINGLQLMIIIMSVLGGFGLAAAATRFMSYHIGGGREDMARGIGRLILKIGLISSSLVSFTLYIFSGYIATIFFHNSHYEHLVHLASVDVFLYTMIQLSVYILYSFQEFKKVAMISIFNALLKFAISLGLIVFGLGVVGFVLGLIVGDAVPLLIFVYYLKYHTRRCHQPVGIMRSLFNYSLPLFGAQLLTILSINIDYYLILILSGLYTAGLYSPSVMVASALFMAQTALEQTLLPYFSRMYGKSGIKSLNDLSRFASRYLFLIYLPMGFATLVSLSPLIIGIFGERYSGAVYTSAVLVLAITLASIGTLFSNILMSVGHNRIILKGSLIALSVQLSISIATIPSIGALGAAFARASAYAITFIVPALRLKKIAGLHYDRSALQKGMVGSIVMASITLVLNFYFNNKYYFLPLSLLTGFIVYLAFLRFTDTMNEQDFQIMNTILSGKLKRPMAILAKIVIR